MSSAAKSPKQRITTELGLFTGLLFLGFVIMPIAIFLVGDAIFGDYGGNGYGDFFRTLSAKIRGGDKVAWFLVLSPYLAILILRVMAWGWRRSAQT